MNSKKLLRDFSKCFILKNRHMASITKMNISPTVSDSSLDNNHNLEEQKKNRRIVRKLFKEGEYVTVERSFGSEDDAAKYEEYYDEKMEDLYDEIREFESEYGTKLAGLDTCEAELRIMKEWIGMAIAEWDKEDEEERGGSHIVHPHGQRKGNVVVCSSTYLPTSSIDG